MKLKLYIKFVTHDQRCFGNLSHMPIFYWPFVCSIIVLLVFIHAFTCFVFLSECESLKFLLPKMIVQRLQRSKSNGYSGPNQDSCVRMSSLGRFDWAKETFNLSYLFVDQMAVPSPLELDKIPVEDNSVLVTSFSVLKPNDLGGTLVIEGHLELDTFDVGFTCKSSLRYDRYLPAKVTYCHMWLSSKYALDQL